MKYIKLLEGISEVRIFRRNLFNKVENYVNNNSLNMKYKQRYSNVDLTKLNIVNDSNRHYIKFDINNDLSIVIPTPESLLYNNTSRLYRITHISISVSEIEDDYYIINIHFPSNYCRCIVDQLSEVKKTLSNVIKILITE